MFARQLGATLTKNWKLNTRRRSICLSVILIPPAIAVFTCFYGRFIFTTLGVPTMSPYLNFPEVPVPTFSYVNASAACARAHSACFLGVAPDTSQTRTFAASVATELADNASSTGPPLRFFATHNDLFTAIELNSSNFFAGLHIPDPSNPSNFTLLFDKNILPRPKEELTNNIFSGSMASLYNASIYLKTGYATLQQAVERVFMRSKLPPGRKLSVSFLTKMLPTSFTFEMGPILSYTIALFDGMALVPLMLMGLVQITSEKVTKTREYMFILGMRKNVYWLSWALTLLVPALFNTVVMAVLKAATKMIFLGDLPFIIFFHLLLNLSCICFCFAVQAVVSSAIVSLAIGFLWATLPVAVLGAIVPSIGAAQAACSLLAPYTLYLATTSTTGVALNAPSLSALPKLIVLLVLLFDCALYSVIAWYLNEVFTGEYGISKGWLFFAKKSYWVSKRKGGLPVHEAAAAAAQPVNDSDSFENVPHAGGIGVRLSGLSKIFNPSSTKPVHAVDTVSASFEKGRITSLLGQNGAGKTTIISMLCGIISPTAGDAEVEGMSIANDMDHVRSVIGVCPQDDVLFPTLNAVEHLTFVAALKNLSKDVARLAGRSLEEVGLMPEDHRGRRVSTFSGGMKRKLSLAIAIVGDPRVVYLDEPTSGVDPVSKRSIWEVLRRIRENRTVLLTTHSMEEADNLSDFIYVLAQGKLKCGGSPMFLKHRYGVGYFLTVDKKDGCETAELLRAVQSVIQTASLLSDSRKTASIRLPFGTTDRFQFLFSLLEAQGPKLGVAGYGLSLTTLEDVFVRINTEGDIRSDAASGAMSPTPSMAALAAPAAEEEKPEKEPEEGTSLLKAEGGASNPPRATAFQQFLAVTKMQMLFYRRNIKSTLALLLVPIFLVALLIIILMSTSQQILGQRSPAKIHTITNYTSQTIPYSMAAAANETAVEALLSAMHAATPVKFLRESNMTNLLKFAQEKGDIMMGLFFNHISIPAGELSAVLLYNRSESDSGITLMNFVHSGFLGALSGTAAQPLLQWSQAVSTSIQNTILGSLDMKTMSFAVAIVFSMILVVSDPMERIIAQRECGLRNQMQVAGLRPTVYFCSGILVAILVTLPSMFIIAVAAAIYGVHLFTTIQILMYVIGFLLFIVGLSALNVLFSYAFSRPMVATVIVTFVYLIWTTFAYLIKLLWVIKPDIAIKFGSSGREFVMFIFGIVPPFGFINFLGSLAQLPVPTTAKSMFSGESGVIVRLVNVLISTAFWVGFAILVELLKGRIGSPRTSLVPSETVEGEDDDVAAENRRVESGSAAHDAMIATHLHKEYKKGTTVVGNLSFGIAAGEVFGLLGPNGAGKSTTINMLTGEVPITSGTASLGGVAIRGFKADAFAAARLGRCPQSGGLIEYLTGREHLELMLRIKSNISRRQIDSAIAGSLSSLGLTSYADRQVKGYSGGMSRKLCVAIALLPGTNIIILDECSTGMDVVARRSLWAAIQRERSKPGKVVLLTTHSMEEAESTCTTIGIIAKGELKCFGSVQHLKNKFSEGYVVSVELVSQRAVEACDRFVGEIAAPTKAILVDAVDCRRTYSIGTPRSFAALFQRLEKSKDEVGIKSYAVTQSSLETVFIRIVKKHEEEYGTQVNPATAAVELQSTTSAV